MGELNYAVRPVSEFASTPAELKFKESVQRALANPAKERPRNDWEFMAETLAVLPTNPADAVRLPVIMEALKVDRPQLDATLKILIDRKLVKSLRLKQRGGPKVYWKVAKKK